MNIYGIRFPSIIDLFLQKTTDTRFRVSVIFYKESYKPNFIEFFHCFRFSKQFEPAVPLLPSADRKLQWLLPRYLSCEW